MWWLPLTVTHTEPQGKATPWKNKVSIAGEPLKPHFSPRSAGWDKIHTSLFLTSKQAFWSGWIEAVTSPLGIFRSFLFQIRCSGPCLQRESSPWLVSVSKATDQPNKAAGGGGGGGAGRAGPGAAEPSLPASCFLGTFLVTSRVFDWSAPSSVRGCLSV